jgi:PAS domain S-box-containing protein
LGSDNEIIALIKIDGIILSHLENVRNDLKIIMGYFAIILKNELMTTERLKKADQALQEQMNKRMEEQERYINIIESSFDGFWVADGEGRFLEVNDIYCSMSGYNRDELLSMNIPQVEALESVAETNEHMMQIKKNRKGAVRDSAEVSGRQFDRCGGELHLHRIPGGAFLCLSQRCN